MGKGTPLTQVERAQISAFSHAGFSSRRIAKEVGRSHTVISRYLKDKASYGVARSPGRPSRLSSTSLRHLFREASKGRSSCRELVTHLSLPVTHRRVQQLLQANPELVYKKRKSTPKLTPRHEQARVMFAQEQVISRRDWTGIIFSDEKKFNLDGPDGWQYYWHKLGNDEQIYSKRQNGGGSVMIWGAFSSKGKSELRILEGTQDSYEYVSTLSDFLLPFAHAKYGYDFVFQQDNASIHTSRETMEWFSDQELALLSWPALSPDLNPIENLWAIMARRVYPNGRQFTTREGLVAAILKAWDDITQETLDKLVESMPKRCIEVLLNHGKKINY
jgi:transposase